MSTTGLKLFDETVHLTNLWLKQLMDDLDWTERERAFRALRVTLHALRDRLEVNAAAHLAAQLPILIRGVYYEGWRPAATPSRDRTAADFIAHVEDAFSRDPDEDPRRIVEAVFDLLDRHISEGEMEDVRRTLPEQIRGLFR
jgi:uncharacterized protein (DUF2267 family)